jgi:endonuclease/exonuclease/phosphatase family metal-dependent hydrolase
MNKIFYLLAISSIILAQSPVKIMSYNLLNYPGSDTTFRNPYFRTVVSSVSPDIITVQEMISQAGVDGFLNNVMKSFGRTYSSGLFIDGPDTDNAIFYDSTLFIFIANNPIATTLRNISEFVLKSKTTGDTIRIYSVHLKAGSTSADQTQRATEVDSLRKVTDKLPPNSNFIVCGDYNMQASTELAFQKLLSQTKSGYFVDTLNLVGTWYNNAAFARYHTQSTRTRSLPDGGATGGMDDRFDIMLMSQAIINQGGVTYSANTYTAYGNDGLHLNDSINKPTNIAVGQTIANALHYSSDHLPIFASFNFAPTDTTITLNLTAFIEGFYNGLIMIPDTVTAYLHQSISPYAKIDSVKIRLDSLGSGNGKFFNTPSGTYYIVIKHRNSIETWSKAGGEAITKGSSITYNFTNDSSKAFGNNMKKINNKWCIYSGDVNQDRYVNLTDITLIGNDAFNYPTGYRLADLNGDGYVDLNDLTICDNNSYKSVSTKKP